jgi:hypothetical protein
MTVAKLRLAMASGLPESKTVDLFNEIGITRKTLFRHVSPDGILRDDGIQLLSGKKK